MSNYYSVDNNGDVSGNCYNLREGRSNKWLLPMSWILLRG